MDKYLVKPTKIIDERGFVYSAATLDETSGFNDLKKKIDELNTETILALQDRVYNLETVNGAINDRIEAAEEVSNEAKTTANAAHSIASGLQEAVGNVESTAVKAQEKALEAYNSLHSLNADFENLKGRIEDLEATDGEASVPIVGNSKLGYVSDFTDYGLNNQYYVQADWKDESRSLQFGAESNLGDVLEEMMYVTASGITNINNRVSALENNSSGSTAHGNCLENQVSIRQFYMVDKNDLIADGVPEEEIPALREQTINMPAAEGIENAYALAKSVKTKINVNVLPRLEALESGSGGSSSSGTCNCPSDVSSRLSSIESKNTSQDNTLLSHTNSIQSLDTRTGSHTASIGQLENRMTDVDNYSKANRTMITGVATSLSNTESDVSELTQTLEEVKTDISNLQSVTNYLSSKEDKTETIIQALAQLNSDFETLEEDVETLKNNDSSCSCPSDVESRLTALENKPECSCPSDVESRLTALENNSGSSGESTNITHIGDHNLKSDGSTFSFANVDTHDVYRFKTLNEVLEVILPIIEDLIERLYTLEYRFDTTEH